jgi:hypothetical protein
MNEGFSLLIHHLLYCPQVFYEKYQFLMGPRSEDLPGQIEQFLTGLGLGDGDIQIGQSKVCCV